LPRTPRAARAACPRTCCTARICASAAARARAAASLSLLKKLPASNTEINPAHGLAVAAKTWYMLCEGEKLKPQMLADRGNAENEDNSIGCRRRKQRSIAIAGRERRDYRPGGSASAPDGRKDGGWRRRPRRIGWALKPAASESCGVTLSSRLCDAIWLGS